MCILTKKEILNLISKGELEIEPFSEEMVEVAEINLRLGNNYAIIKDSDELLDLSSRDALAKSKTLIYEFYDKSEQESYIIYPRRSYLIESLEYIKLPKNLTARIEMRSTFSRHGLLTPPTSIAPGFSGTIMFHLTGSTFPIKLGKNVSVFKIILETTISDTRGYSGVYQNQNGITLPLYNDNIIG